jgi:Uma2 family endonuclease
MSTNLHATHVVTAGQLEQLSAQGHRYELIAGRLNMMSPAGGEHGRVAARVLMALASHVRAHNLGEVFAAETGFLIARDPDTVRAPDAAFVSRDRLATLASLQGYLPLAPDFAAEVISPGEKISEVTDKTLAWLAAGVKLVLVVDTQARTMQGFFAPDDVERVALDGTLDARHAVPGWHVSAAEVFGD